MTEAAAFFEGLPKKRMGAGALLFDANGRVLVLKPGYKSHWEIPGGIVEADESPREAARREIREEIGLDIAEDRLELVGLDYMAAGGEKTESLMFVFSAGVLSEEEIASIVDAGIRFECVLMAGFSMELVTHPDLSDPSVVYALHEMGEETRHSRLFSRLLTQLQPEARNPLSRLRVIERFMIQRFIRRPATFDVLVLGGEEIPDLFQKLASEHPDTDPFVRDVNRYHRSEEARHLAFARAVLPERWEQATAVDRFLVRHVVPWIIGDMFRMLVHPGVYKTIGLPAFDTWKRANRTPARVAIRQQATRPILDTLVANGVFKPGRIPKAWRQLTGA